MARLAAQLHAGADLTGAEVAAQLGCSERTGRRLLRQAQDHTRPGARAPAGRESGRDADRAGGPGARVRAVSGDVA